MRQLLIIFFTLIAVVSRPVVAQNAEPDTKTLGRALDYFMGGKYHEALMLLVRLDRRYDLNPRFKAYIGVCYYHEWEYAEACRYLDPVMDDIEIYAPYERSVYYNSAAESHFQLQQYREAIPLYERQLLVCHDNEKADAHYRLGFCHMFLYEWATAIESFTSAKDYYRRYNAGTNAARLSQIDRMIAGCEAEMGKPKS